MEATQLDPKSKDYKYGQKGTYEDYEISGAAETLSIAEEIRADKNLLGYAEKCLKEEIKSKKKVFNSIQELRDYAGRDRDLD